MHNVPAAVIIALLLGASLLAQSVTFDFERSADFARFKTYTWVPGTPLSDAINHNRIVAAVSAQLAARGLTRVEERSGADLFVAYHATFDRDLQISGFSSGWGPYRFGGGSGTARTDRILTGTLAVDLVDPRTSTIVWRGIASKEIDVKADAGKRENNINRAAERLFKNYPPAR